MYGQKVQEVTYELVSGRRVRVRGVDLSVEPGEMQAQVCRLFSWGGEVRKFPPKTCHGTGVKSRQLLQPS